MLQTRRSILNRSAYGIGGIALATLLKEQNLLATGAVRHEAF
jgi:hypothetical protein